GKHHEFPFVWRAARNSSSVGPDGLTLLGRFKARIARAIAFSLRIKSFNLTAVPPAKRSARIRSLIAVSSAALRIIISSWGAGLPPSASINSRASARARRTKRVRPSRSEMFRIYVVIRGGINAESSTYLPPIILFDHRIYNLIVKQ